MPLIENPFSWSSNQFALPISKQAYLYVIRGIAFTVNRLRSNTLQVMKETKIIEFLNPWDISLEYRKQFANPQTFLLFGGVLWLICETQLTLLCPK